MNLKNRFIAPFALALLSLPAFARAGGMEGGGGNGAVAEFYDFARLFSQTVIQRPDLAPEISPGLLKQVVGEAKISAMPTPLILNGSKVDAINYPDKKEIDIDDTTWLSHPENVRYRNVIHELLGIMRIQDVQYALSQQLAEKTTASFQLQIRVVCSVKGQNDYFVSALKDEGEPASLRLFHNEVLITEITGADVTELTEGIAQLNATASGQRSTIKINSDYDIFGGDLSDPGTETWNGVMYLSPDLISKIPRAPSTGRLDIVCNDDV